jgi:large subunit ribosomal protein L18e
MRRTGPTNFFLRKLINELKKVSNKENVKIWKEVAYYLERPRRERVEVNIGKIQKLAKEGETIIIPGKLLGGGLLNKKVTVVFYQASKEALRKLEKAGARGVTIEEYIKENPKGSNTRIFV